ncbi:MAG: DUF1800 domain-containing protein [Phycisphaerae bacterium]|nr:DUF1800 domain-containing protein [Phycisphaerae bacterium]
MQPRRNAAMSPIKPAAFGFEQARHLLWRAGFGGTPAQVQTLVSWGPERSVDYLLDFEKAPTEPVSADLFDRDIMRPPTREEQAALALARRTMDENAVAEFRRQRMERERLDRQQMSKIRRWWLQRMIETPRPLEERMTLFWHGHFATSYRTIENSYHMFAQNGLFRTHAVGNFGDLLFAIIRDPAMLAYLDQNDSRKNRPNENLARELMELFSLGVGAYTERDIKEGARALTGFTFDDDEFVFRANDHDASAKTILGVSGNLDGDDFVKAILGTRACSRFMARKLYAYFVADLLPWEAAAGDRGMDGATRGAIDDLASTMLASRYEIKPVLRRLFLSEHFYGTSVMGQQIKSPAQLVVGAVRSLGAPPRDLSVLADALDLMGQNLFYPPSVKGWDGGRSWINTSTLFIRQNVLAYLLTGKRPQGYDALANEEKYDPSPLIADLVKADPSAGRDPERVAEYLLRFTIGSAPESALRTLAEFARERGTGVSRDMLVGMLLLISAMPEYQLC